MSAVNWPITLEEESDFDIEFAWEDDDCNPIDVSAYGAKFQIRNHPDQDPLLTASTVNGRVSKAAVSGVTSVFVINVPASTINAIKDLVEDGARYTFLVWPGAATPGVDPKRLVEGNVEYTRSFTQ